MTLNENSQIFNDALNEAAKLILFSPIDLVKDELFLIWQEAIHRILINNGCPCQIKGSKQKCFKECTQQEQINLFDRSHPYGFEEFIMILQEAKKLTESYLSSKTRLN